MWRWTVEGWSRCHQLMELGRGSSEKCLRNLQNVEMSSKSGREIASLGNWTEQLSRGSCCSRHLKWTHCQQTVLSLVEQQKKYTCRSSLKSQVIGHKLRHLKRRYGYGCLATIFKTCLVSILQRYVLKLSSIQCVCLSKLSQKPDF